MLRAHARSLHNPKSVREQVVALTSRISHLSYLREGMKCRWFSLPFAGACFVVYTIIIIIYAQHIFNSVWHSQCVKCVKVNFSELHVIDDDDANAANVFGAAGSILLTCLGLPLMFIAFSI